VCYFIALEPFELHERAKVKAIIRKTFASEIDKQENTARLACDTQRPSVTQPFMPCVSKLYKESKINNRNGNQQESGAEYYAYLTL
jgi:hypothetical protein